MELTQTARPTPEELFKQLDSRLRADPSRTARINAVYQFVLTGDDGGRWHLVIRDGTGVVRTGDAPKADATITMKASDFVSMTLGEMDRVRAFMRGAVRIKGSIALLAKLQRITGEATL
jgi:putative sterol carrier protein